MSKKIFEQEQERTLQQIEDNIENINSLIDERSDIVNESIDILFNKPQQAIDDWQERSLNIINKEMSDYERASGG